MTKTAQIKGSNVYKFVDLEVAKNIVKLLTEDTLSSKQFKECGDYDSLKVGFTPFVEDSYLLETKGSVAFQVTSQKKTPKSSQVKALCKEKEKVYMEENGLEDLDKETKDEIKRLVVESLLPSTFPDEPVTVVMWITENTLMVGTPSSKKAEELISFVRGVIGTLPVTPLAVKEDVTQKLTDMVSVGYSETITLGNKVELIGEEGETITFAKCDVSMADTETHIDNGAMVSKLGMEHDGAMKFVLNTDLEISAIKVNKDILMGSKDIGALIVTMDEVNLTVKGIVELFGGVVDLSE